MNTKSDKNEQISTHYIKIGRFEFKSRNFWLSVLISVLLFILATVSVLCYTAYKITDIIVNHETTSTSLSTQEK